MDDVTIRVCQDHHVWLATLDPAGTTIGRSESCDIVIGSKHVSRRHARVSGTPDGEWLLENLSGSNGTFVNGERVESCAISAADVIDIGPASLSFGALDEQVTLPAFQAPNLIIEDFGTEIFYDKPQLSECERPPCPERFGQIKHRLSELTDKAAFYPEICRLLAHEPKTAAAVFLAANASSSEATAPEVLSCYFGTRPQDARAGTGDSDPSHLAFRVSHRLLKAVRKEGRALMTKSIFSCDSQITMSAIDENSPRALLCAPVGGTGDLLYVDTPIAEWRQPGPEEMFAFIQAVAGLVGESDGE